jgi:histidinol-phosphate phosphatase family protein
MEKENYTVEIMKSWKLDRSWTLFLDRDGVINRRKIGGYISMIDEFEFLPDVLNAFSLISPLFKKIIVVTNQQGIGKGLITEQTVHQIHDYMIDAISNSKGRIDRVYFSPYLASKNHVSRKPNTGMAVQAANDFPEITFKKSIMVGDSRSDMQFARTLNIKAVFIGNPEENNISDNDFDICFPSFYEFAKEIYNIFVIQ